MAIFKRGRIYWYKFMWNGEMIRESTKQGSDKKTRNIESAHRTLQTGGRPPGRTLAPEVLRSPTMR